MTDAEKIKRLRSALRELLTYAEVAMTEFDEDDEASPPQRRARWTNVRGVASNALEET